jgi:hypothetical protein
VVDLVSNYILLTSTHLLRSYTQTCKLKADQDTTAVTKSSKLCLFPYLFPLQSLTFGYLFWLLSPFLKKTGILLVSPSKNIVLTRNTATYHYHKFKPFMEMRCVRPLPLLATG